MIVPSQRTGNDLFTLLIITSWITIVVIKVDTIIMNIMFQLLILMAIMM